MSARRRDKRYALCMSREARSEMTLSKNVWRVLVFSADYSRVADVLRKRVRDSVCLW